MSWDSLGSVYFMDESKVAEGFFRAIMGIIPGIFTWLKNKSFGRKKYSDDEIKKITRVLFIDDEKFGYIDRIKEAGWSVSQIFDLNNLDEECVRQADIVFLDYKGVGRSLSQSEEGIGLLKALKKKYPAKPIILYSAHAGFNLGDEFDLADDWLPKNADTYVYIQKIEEFAQKIHGA